MDHKAILTAVSAMVQQEFTGESSGHDWCHIERVWKMAKRLSIEENSDTFVVELAALLHDIADWKFHNGDKSIGSKRAREILASLDVEPKTINEVAGIIEKIGFLGAKAEHPELSLEGKIVQDADFLDAIGALGIARTFAYGGNQQKPMHTPEISPVLHQTKEEYVKNQSSTINHFYEKLLLLKERMHTKTAKRLAEERHAFMKNFLNEFFLEWEGKR